MLTFPGLKAPGFKRACYSYGPGNGNLGVEPSTIRFGVFEVDLNSGELRKQGVRIKLQEQPYQALVALIEHPREVVTRDELQKRLWPGGIAVDFDSGLNKA